MDEENRIIADMAAFLGIPFNRRTGPFMKQCADRIRAYGDRRAQEVVEAEAIDEGRIQELIDALDHLKEVSDEVLGPLLPTLPRPRESTVE